MNVKRKGLPNRTRRTQSYIIRRRCVVTHTCVGDTDLWYIHNEVETTINYLFTLFIVLICVLIPSLAGVFSSFFFSSFFFSFFFLYLSFSFLILKQ